MIYLDSSYGQLCNRIFNISSFLSNAIYYNLNLLVFGFEEYDQYFDLTYLHQNHKKIKILKHSTINRKIVRKIIFYFLKKLSQIPTIKIFYYHFNGGDLNSKEIKKNILERSCLFKGWPYWDVELFKLKSNELRKIFTPKKEYIDNAKRFLLKHKNNSDIVIGVHIRRGDYIDFYNGRFYFDNDYYIYYIKLLNSILVAKGHNPLFIICSNQPDNIYIENINIIVSNNNPMVDLLLLSNCQYIFGPPSTFSMWASFYGQVPLYWLGLNNTFNLNMFSTIVAPNTFENGINITL